MNTQSQTETQRTQIKPSYVDKINVSNNNKTNANGFDIFTVVDSQFPLNLSKGNSHRHPVRCRCWCMLECESRFGFVVLLTVSSDYNFHGSLLFVLIWNCIDVFMSCK